MLGNLSFDNIVINFGTKNFGFGFNSGRPAVFLLGFPVYLYALIIVTGMCVAILIAGWLFKKRGYDPYDICIYAIFVILFGVLGARMYVFIFPWEGVQADWSTFFTDFRNGGLGIYGGVILGYIAAFIVSKVKKQDFRIITDCIMPGLLIAQSIGRWGNFVNQEAFGNAVTNPSLQWFPFAVYIDAKGGWFQATFFYESLATFIGFVICLLLIRSKKYKLGWLTAFYGIYYGIVRLLVEGLRTDSLFLWIGKNQTDIRISQLVSVFAILFGIITLTRVYRKELHSLYSKMFKNERDEVSKSRYITLAVAAAFVGVAITMFALGGETKFIAGAVLAAIAVYCIMGFFALSDRLKLYCRECGARHEIDGGVINEAEKNMITFWGCVALGGALIVAAVPFIVLGFTGGVPNRIVVGVIFMLVAAALAVKAYYCFTAAKSDGAEIVYSPNEKVFECCGKEYKPKLNKFLLTLFPYKVYKDYGVENLKEFVDPDKLKKKQAKEAKQKTGEK